MKFINYSHIKTSKLFFPVAMNALCRWMTDFLEKSILFRWLVWDFPKWKGESERRVYSINETSAASAILKSSLNMTTTSDSYYQTTNNRNKRKNDPKLLINMDKLKICFTWLRTPHVFRLSNLKRIPS